MKYGKHLYKFSRFMDVEGRRREKAEILFTLTSIYIVAFMQTSFFAFAPRAIKSFRLHQHDSVLGLFLQLTIVL